MFNRKKEMDRQADGILLLVRRLTSVVFVSVIGIERNIFAHREQAAPIEIGRAPFGVLAFVIGLGSGIGNQVIGMDPKGAFDG